MPDNLEPSFSKEKSELMNRPLYFFEADPTNHFPFREASMVIFPHWSAKEKERQIEKQKDRFFKQVIRNGFSIR